MTDYPSQNADKAEAKPYTIRFSRIGRNHHCGPLHLDAVDAEDIATQVHGYARRFLGSRDVEVLANLDEMRGLILCGMRSGGDFTIQAGHTVILPASAERAVANVLLKQLTEGGS